MKTLILTTVVILIAGAAVFYTVRTLQSSPPQHLPQTHNHDDDDFLIEGRVINASGETVAGADVFAELDGAAGRGISTDVSDNNGNFRLAVRNLGRYTIYGSKEADGYPLTVSGFINQ